MRHLILGGARSGKSALAEQLALDSGLEVVYIATATSGDAEMAERIAHHRKQRPGNWRTIEEPLALAGVLARESGDNRCLIVDCLTLWLSNLLAEDEARLVRERDALLAVVPQLQGRILLVSNETGMGVVPMGELSRRFVDESGRLHQQLAQQCERVSLVVAGLPMCMKG